MRLFKQTCIKTRSDGVTVTYYEPCADIYVQSYDLKEDRFVRRKVTGYSRHDNVRMFKVSSLKGDFKPFSVSYDDSLIVLHDNKPVKVSPLKIKENPSAYSLIRKGYSPVPATDISIEDEGASTAYDLTVEGTFTFCNDDGIVLQDTMAAYFPITVEAETDVKENIHIDANMYTKCGGKLTLEPDHDIVYGIYILSMKKPDALPAPLYKYMIENKLTSIDRKSLKEFLDEYIKSGDSRSRAKILDELSQIGFMVSTRYSEALLSVENIKKSIVPIEERRKLYDEYISGNITMSQYMEKEKEMTESIHDVCPMTGIVESGSRGSWDQLRQLFVSRGFVTDISGEVIKVPIYKNLIEGLDSKSMFLSCYGVRKGLGDIADNTAVSGVMTRQMIYMAANTFQSSSRKDCGTNSYLPVTLNNETEARAVIGRYIFIDNNRNMERITEKNYKNYIGCEIKLRSPIFCEGKHLCSYCCPHKKRSELEGKRWNVGLVAAASLSEPLTQMVLRTFHHSGSVRDGGDVIQDLAGVRKFFSKPKFTSKNVQNAVMTLFRSFVSKKFIKLLYFEILISCMMWTTLKDGRRVKWRRHQKKRMYPISMNKVPSYETFLLGASYGCLSGRLINSIGRKVGATPFESLICD